MKKLKLGLNGLQPMSKADMKKISGGHDGCIVGCESWTNSYACCTYNGVWPTCFCQENGTSPMIDGIAVDCNAGGPGYSACVVSPNW